LSRRSLNYLRKLPLHKVKIDRSFVCDVLTRKDCAAIVANVTRLAADLGMTIVAEGVETIAQLEWLRGIGCREAQGYLISPPLTCDELRVFAADWRPERLARQTQNEISA
jgi:EAL domain-containing protein (putative c-di-GMP-specific phosphodiesterase class I)